MVDAFWDFSLAFYGREGVSAACIALQDEYGADVDMVLFALWCARRGCQLSDAELRVVDARIAPWRQAVVQPIRQARRALKPAPAMVDEAGAGALRKLLLGAELDAERLQQRAMEEDAPPPGTMPTRGAAQHNLALVARFSGIPQEAVPVGVLLQAFK